MSALTIAVVVLPLGGAIGVAQDAAAVQRGEALYVEERCALCHSVGDTGNQRGPLDDVGERLTRAELERWMIDPDGMTDEVGSTRQPAMPDYTDLSQDDLSAMISYLQTLTP